MCWKRIGGSEINTYMLHNKSAMLSRPCGAANKNTEIKHRKDIHLNDKMRDEKEKIK